MNNDAKILIGVICVFIGAMLVFAMIGLGNVQGLGTANPIPIAGGK